MISAIFAMARGGVIGKENSLPWRIPKDWEYFKKTTLGTIIVMGRKTWDSIGRPLPGRRNVVLTRNKTFQPTGCEVCNTVDEVLDLIRESHEKEAFIIGGAEIYDVFMPYCDRLYVTFIDADILGDTYFSNPNLEGWKLVHSKTGEMDEKNTLPFEFQIYERAVQYNLYK